MLGPLDYVAMQAFKGDMSTQEREVLERELLHEWLWGIAGIGIGGYVGYYITRRSPSSLIKWGSYSFNALLTSSLAMCLSGYSSINKMNNEERYPRTVAAMRELSQGQGGIRICPRGPNDGPTQSEMRRPGLARLPSQGSAENKVGNQSEFGTSHYGFGSSDHQQQEDAQQYQFGNPNLPLGQESQDQEFGNLNLSTGKKPEWSNSSAWDAIRGGSSMQPDFWDRLRNQNTKQNANISQPKDVFGNATQSEDLVNTSDNNDGKPSDGPVFGS
ncbi:hypothetical protein H4R24_000089 [Coemansia sp. RSA 988]|nr:hypothetical protein H4R24_000089 [Coemansia sp. RSA 988]